MIPRVRGERSSGTGVSAFIATASWGSSVSVSISVTWWAAVRDLCELGAVFNLSVFISKRGGEDREGRLVTGNLLPSLSLMCVHVFSVGGHCGGPLHDGRRQEGRRGRHVTGMLEGGGKEEGGEERMGLGGVLPSIPPTTPTCGTRAGQACHFLFARLTDTVAGCYAVVAFCNIVTMGRGPSTLLFRIPYSASLFILLDAGSARSSATGGSSRSRTFLYRSYTYLHRALNAPWVDAGCFSSCMSHGCCWTFGGFLLRGLATAAAPIPGGTPSSCLPGEQGAPHQPGVTVLPTTAAACLPRTLPPPTYLP